MTQSPEIRVFDGLEPLSWAAATRFEENARVKAMEKKPFTVALSGGSTPKLLYELLGSPTFAGRVRWPNVHLFQVDERCVPPDDPQSNYRMIRQALLESAPLPEENFHRMAAERPDREQAAHEYAEELARVLHPAPGEWPRLDLVFLGFLHLHPGPFQVLPGQVVHGVQGARHDLVAAGPLPGEGGVVGHGGAHLPR